MVLKLMERTSSFASASIVSVQEDVEIPSDESRGENERRRELVGDPCASPEPVSEPFTPGAASRDPFQSQNSPISRDGVTYKMLHYLFKSHELKNARTKKKRRLYIAR